MATPKILLKRSNVAGSVPSSLDSGEFALNTADGKIYYTGHDGNIHAFLDSAGVNTLIENSVATIDSAQVIQLIDSDYVQARQLTYTIPTLGNDFVDSAQVQSIINAAYVKNIVDSAYVASIIETDGDITITITNEITSTVDSAYVNERVNTANFLDSAEAINIVDSSYVRLRADSAYIKSVTGIDADTLDGEHGTHYLDYNNFTNTPTILDNVDIENQIDSDYVRARQITYDTSDFTDSDYVEDRIDSAINALIGGAPDALNTLNELAEALGDDSDAYNTLLSQIGALPDSAEVKLIIDSAYIQLRQIKYLDSDLVKAISLDSSEIPSVVTQQYVRDRQDFRFDQLIGAPTSLSDFANDLFTSTNDLGEGSTNLYYTTARTESDATALVDSAYVQARQITYTIPSLGNDFVDSAEALKLIDANALDSGRATALIDSAYVQARQLNFDNLLDSAEVTALVDSDYVQARQITYTLPVLGTDFVDSDQVEAIVDSAYVQLRQTAQDFAYSSLTDAPTIPAFGTDYVDSAFVTNLPVSTFTNDANYLDSTTVLPLIPKLGTDFIDSAEALKLIDANALDSGRATSLVDSDYVQLRQTAQDFSYASLTGTPTNVSTFTNDAGYLTNATTTSLIDSAYVKQRVNTNQDLATTDSVTFSGLTVSGNLNVTGTTYQVNTIAYTINDPLIHLADSNETSDVVDIGFIGHYYGNAQRRHAGVFRDASNEEFYIFNNMVDSSFDSVSPPNTINRSATGFQLATLNVGAIYGQYQGFDSDFNQKSTTDLSEGSNLYYTKARADSDIAASLNDSGNTVNITINNTIEDKVDSAYVLARVNEAPFLDSVYTTALVDSAYVQLRQDYAYGSLTGTPTIPAFGTDYVDSAFVTGQNVSAFANDANYLDSTTVTGVIDSAYINLKAPSLEYVAINSTGALPTAQTDGAIAIGSKATTNSTRHGIPAGGNRAIAIGDSAEAIGHDAIAIGTNATTGSDGYYIEGVAIGKNATIEGGSRGTAVGGNSKATLQAAAFGHGADARGDYSVALGNQTTIDSSHNNSVAIGRLAVTSAANQLMLGDDDDAVSGFTSIRVGNRSYEPSDDYDLATKLYVDSQITSSTLSLGTDFIDSAEALILIDANALDSGRAILLIDSAYIQARQSAGTDSAATIALINANALDSGRAITLIDSAYVQARTTAGTDSAAILQLIDSSYVSNRLDSSYINNVSLQQVTYVYTADSGQTAFTGADDNGLTLATGSNARVSLNGILLLNTVDYTRVGDTVTLTVGADSGDILTVEKFTGRDAALDSSLINNVDISFTQYVYTADSGDTTFSGADDNGLTLAYSPSRVRVHINGILQVDSADYTASNGTSVTLIEEANAGDVIQIEKFVGRDVGLDSAEVKLVIDSAYIQARTTAGTDSAAIIQLIDSSYVQARQITYTLPVLGTDFVDSAEALKLIDANALDSDRVKGVIDSAYINAAIGVANDSASTTLIILDVVDSAYVQLRQDFAYGSLTGTPTIPAFGTDYIDSATVVDIIASEGLDSDLVINLVDSAYIQLRDRFQDSSGVTAIVDSSYIELRRPPEAIFNVVNNGASAYTFTGDGFSSSDDNPTIYLQRGLTYKFSVNASGHPFEIRVSNGGAAYSTGVTNNAAETGTVLFTPDMSAPNSLVYQCTNHSGMVGDIVILDNSSFLDSSTVTDVIDASYINGLTIDADTLGGQNSAYHLNYDNFTNTPTLPVLGTDFVDSAQVQLIVDSAYVQARTTAGTDSAATIALIEATVDSAYVQLREGDGGGGGSQNVFQNIHVSGQDSIVADGTSDILTFEAGHGIDITTDANTDTITIAYGLEEDHLDSAAVRNIIDTELQDGNTIKRNVFTYEADSGDTTFSGADINSQILNVVPDNTIVFVNGILMLETTDYTLTSSTLTMTAAVDSGYSVTIIENVGKSETLLYTEAKYEYTLDSGTTYVTGADNDSVTLVLNTTTDNIDVFMNGILLSETADYTIDSSSITLIDDADSADLLTIVTRRGDVVTPAINAFEYTADSGQTSFTGSDDNSATLKYSSGAIQVHVNGILLRETDYTATNGTSVVLTEAADSGDDILISAFSAPAKFSHWTEVTATQAVASNTKNIIDCSSASVTVTFPAAPDLGDEIRIIDGTGSAATNNIIINRNGNKIQGAADNFTIDVNRAAVGFVYYNAAQGWILIEN